MRLAGERVFDLDLVRTHERLDAADREVTATVDDVARVAVQAERDHVGHESFADATAVDAHTRRSSHDRRPVVDLNLALALRRMRAGRAARRTARERLRERRRLTVGERLRVPNRLELGHERGVDETARALCCPEAGAHHRAQHPRCRHLGARVAVEHRQLAFGDETRHARGVLTISIPRPARPVKWVRMSERGWVAPSIPGGTKPDAISADLSSPR